VVDVQEDMRAIVGSRRLCSEMRDMRLSLLQWRKNAQLETPHSAVDPRPVIDIDALLRHGAFTSKLTRPDCVVEPARMDGKVRRLRTGCSQQKQCDNTIRDLPRTVMTNHIPQ
jgi:hypothetical protein